MAFPQQARSSIPPAPIALPEIVSGVTVTTLRRVWFATPESARTQARSLIESSVVVERGGVTALVKLVDLTLPEVEARIGAVTPKFVVRFYDPSKKGIQATTFVNERDARTFAAGKRLYGNPAQIKELG